MTKNYRDIKRHEDVDKYISKLKDGSPERIEEARNALIRTGVLTKNGNRKEKIVSWE